MEPKGDAYNWNNQKPDEGKDEVIFHRSKLAPKVYFEDLREGDEVEFLIRPGEKGPQAFNLKPR